MLFVVSRAQLCVSPRVLDRSDDVVNRVPPELRSVMDTPFINCCGAQEMRVLSVWGLHKYNFREI